MCERVAISASTARAEVVTTQRCGCCRCKTGCPHIDELVADLLKGGTTTAKGRTRRPWGAIAVNKFSQTVAMVLADAQRQGLVARNAAEHVDPVAVSHRSVDTYTEAEVQKLLKSIASDRLGHAWELALCGLRRGELAGLRWPTSTSTAKRCRSPTTA